MQQTDIHSFVIQIKTIRKLATTKSHVASPKRSFLVNLTHKRNNTTEETKKTLSFDRKIPLSFEQKL